MFIIHLWLLLNGALHRFPNVDEIGHLAAGVSNWKHGRFALYKVNPPLMQLVAGLPSVFVNYEFNWALFEEGRSARPEFKIGVNQLRTQKLLFADAFAWPRLLCAAFSLFGALLLYVWMRRLLLGSSCSIVLALWFFCPNILAHGPTVIPDLCALFAGVLSAYVFSLYVQQASRSHAALCGFALGIALLSKLTWVTGVISFPFAAYCTLWLRFPRVRPSASARLIDLAVCLLTAILVLNAGYLCEGSLTTLGEFEFISRALGGMDASLAIPSNRFSESVLSRIPTPFPRSYLEGIDFLKYEVETKYWSFLNGEWKFGSWPHYYVMTTLFKTPEATLLGAGIGLGVLVAGIRRRMVEPKVISMFLFLIIPAAVCFASVSLQGGFNHHHRYVLMIYPPMFALAAYVASPVGQKLLRVRLPFGKKRLWSFAVPLAVTLAVLSAASSLRVHPYYTSYFNTLSGGPENGWRLLGFSNIDWGQDILEVDKWLKAHPDRRPLVMDIDYFGMNGDLFDVPTTLPPHLPKGASIDEVRHSITETQWWIISVKRLYNLPDHPGLEYLQQIEPVERIAYAYHVYRIDPLPGLSAEGAVEDAAGSAEASTGGKAEP